MSPNLQIEVYQFATAAICCIRKHWIPKLSDLQQQECIFCSHIFKLLEFCWSGLGSLCWMPNCRTDPDLLYGSLISPGLATQAFYFCGKSKGYIQSHKHISNLCQSSHQHPISQNMSRRQTHYPWYREDIPPKEVGALGSEWTFAEQSFSFPHQFWNFSKLSWHCILFIRYIQIIFNKYFLDINICVPALFHPLFLEFSVKTLGSKNS